MNYTNISYVNETSELWFVETVENVTSRSELSSALIGNGTPTTDPTLCFLKPSTELLSPVLTTVDSAIALLAIFGNCLVITAVIKYPLLRTATNIFVLSLAVADLLVGICIPYYVLFYFDIGWTCEYSPCLIRYFTILFFTLSSMLSNVGVAIDRYLAIVHPLTYPGFLRAWKVTVAIVVVWIYAGVVTALPMLGMNTWTQSKIDYCKNGAIECDLFYIASEAYVLLAIGSHVLITLIITIILYLRIFREAWRQLRTVASLQIDPTFHKETKTARMMVLVLGVSLLGLAPYLIAITLPYVNKSIQQENGDMPHEWSIYKKFAVCFYLSKSSLNPLIYGWKNKEFRHAFFKILRISPRVRPLKEINNSRIFITVNGSTEHF